MYKRVTPQGQNTNITDPAEGLPRRRISDCLQHLAKDDQTTLEEMFRKFLRNEHIGYVLLGDKPLAAGSVTTPDAPPRHFCIGCPTESDWRDWERVRDLFPSRNFEFELKGPSETGLKEVLIYHRTRVAEIVSANLKRFRTIIGSDFTPEDMILSLRSSGSFMNAVGNHQVLAGLLMGFPLESALHFARRKELRDLRDAKRPYCEEELEQLEINLTLGNSGGMIDGVVVPDFLGRKNNREVWAKRENIEATARRISDFLKEPNLLERILGAYCL